MACYGNQHAFTRDSTTAVMPHIADFEPCDCGLVTWGELRQKALGCGHEVELARLRAWVSDLQSGMYVNCVYCGHRYGPGETTPVSMADALKMHIEECPKHPMSALKSEVARLRAQVERLTQRNDTQAKSITSLSADLSALAAKGKRKGTP